MTGTVGDPRGDATKSRVSHQWRWIGLVGAGAFILGCIGYHQLLQSKGTDSALTDYVYGSLSLFLFNPPDGTRLPVALDIARFAAPAATGWAGVKAVTTLFTESTNRIRAWRRKGHVVVCGLGFKGTAFIKALRAAGYHVVAIESDDTNPAINEHRSMGVPVIVGDAQREDTLSRAGVGRAEWLLALCPDDAVNTEIVLSANILSQDRVHGTLNCLAQISDPHLCNLLGELEFTSQSSNWSVTFFNTDDISADLLLDEYPIAADTTAPHILVAHLDPLGQRIILTASQRWRIKGKGQPMIVTVVDDDAAVKIAKFKNEHGRVDNSCTFIAASTSRKDLLDLDSRYRQLQVPPPSHAFVTSYDDEEGVATMLKLHSLESPFTRVLAHSHNYGKAKLLNKLTAVQVFPVFEKACVPEHLVAVSIETLARTIHEIWRDEQRTAGKDDIEWDDPRASALRESSRAQARDIPTKLRILGYLLGPAGNTIASPFSLTEEQVNELALHEHDRWNQEREDAGWTLGPEKDIEKKTTPYLVPFEDLPPDIAEWDRVFVRKIPQIVASAGFTVRRI